MTVDDEGIKDSWKEYMEKLMNEENEWDHKLSAEVKQRSSMLNGSETWPVRTENAVALQRAARRMVRWMWGVKLKDCLLYTSPRPRD